MASEEMSFENVDDDDDGQQIPASGELKSSESSPFEALLHSTFYTLII